MTADPAGVGPKVAGYCPMGCGQTLALDHRGEIRCFEYHCANKRAVAIILDDPQIDHVVTFTEDGFTIRHPLRERIADQLVTCGLLTKVTEYLDTVDDDSRPALMDAPIGAFRASLVDDLWHLEVLA